MSAPESKLLVLWVGRGCPPAADLPPLGIDLRMVDVAVSDASLVGLVPDAIVLGQDAADRASALSEALRMAGGGALAVVRQGEPDDGITSLDPQAGTAAHRAAIAALVLDQDSLSPLPRTIAAGELDALERRLRSERRAAVIASKDRAWVIASGAERVGATAPASTDADLTVCERSRVRTAVLTSAGSVSVAPRRRLKGAAIVVAPGERELELGGLVEGCRALGATVVEIEQDGDVDEVAASSPLLLIVDGTALATSLGAALLTDVRLGRTALLIFDGPASTARDAEALTEVVRLCSAELEVRERIELGELAVGRLPHLDVSRWLAVVQDRTEPIALEVRGANAIARVEVVGGEIDSARYQRRGASDALEGAEALEALRGMTWGAVLAGDPDEVDEGRDALVELGVELAMPPTQEPPAPVKPPSIRAPAKPSAALPRFKVPAPGAPGAPGAAVRRPASVPPPGLLAAPVTAPVPPAVAAPAAAAASAAATAPAASAPVAASATAPAAAPAAATAAVTALAAKLPTPPKLPAPPALPSARDTRPRRKPVTPSDEGTTSSEAASDEAAAHIEPTTASTEAAATSAVRRAADLDGDHPSIGAELESVPPMESLAVTARPPAGMRVKLAELSDPPAQKPPPEKPPASAPAPGLAPPPAALMPGPAAPPAPKAPPPRRVPTWAWAAFGVLLLALCVEGWLYFGPEDPPPPPPPRPAPVVAVVIDAGMPDAPVGMSAEAHAAMIVELETAREAREYAQVETLAQVLLEEEPENALVAYSLALALFRQRRPDEAVVWAERAVEWDGEQGEYRLLVGDIYANRGRFPRALRVWTDCTRDIPLYRPCQRRIDERGP